MPNLPTRNERIARREFCRISGLAFGGLSLGGVLHSRAMAKENGQTAPETSVIFVTLGGGPSQLETYDPKPDAPIEYRGTFRTIRTRLPGVAFCELLPRQAAILDRLTVIRSLHHEQASHIAEHIVETGYDLRSSANARTGEMPSVGSVVSHVRGANPAGLPGYVSIPRHHAYAGPHWLGSQHQLFAVNDDPNEDKFHVSNLALSPQLTADRLKERGRLLEEFDRRTRIHDLTGAAASLRDISQQAFDLVTAAQAQTAFDMSRESPALREKYGRNTFGQRVLLARRLVEAGVPFVTVRMADWDDHQQLNEKIQKRAPQYDQGLAALIEDLSDRGMSRDVLVVAMGEFGRTPRINANAGRDHWPAVNSVIISGGNFRMGQVIGATDAKAGQVTTSPYRPQNFFAMVYHHLGIDPAITFDDYAGRPRSVLEDRAPIRELL